MPPHCDAIDGPVVTGARQALAREDVDLALRFVPEHGEAEVRAAFDQTMQARTQGPAAEQVADRWFAETLVRVHRAGEGAPFTGLKPAGLDHGPVLPVAERAIQTGSADELARLLTDLVAAEVKQRFDQVVERKAHVEEGLPGARAYTQAMLGLQVWANGLYQSAVTDPHQAHHTLEREE